MDFLKKIELLFLFYKSNAREKMRFLPRKINKISSFHMHLLFEAGKMISSSIIVLLLYKNLFYYNRIVYLVVLFLLYFFQNIAVFFDSAEKIKKRFKYSYLQLSCKNYMQKIVVFNYLVESLLLLPMTFPIFIGIIISHNLSVFLFAFFMKVFCFCMYSIKYAQKGTENKFSSWLKLVLCRLIPVGMGYFFMLGISKILLLSRRGVAVYGVSAEYILWVDSEINREVYELINQLTHVFQKWNFCKLNDVRIQITVVILIVFMLLLSIFFIKRNMQKKEQEVFKLPLWYLSGIKKKIEREETSQMYIYKDICLFLKKGENLKKHFIDLCISSEACIVIGSNLALLPFIQNKYIFLFLFSFESFIVISGTLRTIGYWFDDVFRFRNDSERWKLLYFSDKVNVSHILESKYTLLKAVAGVPCFIGIALIYINFIPYMRWECLWLGIDVIIIWGLYHTIIKWVLKSDYDFFCITVKKRFAIEEFSCENYVGYQFIESANKTIHRLFLFSTIFIAIVASCFVLIAGWQWMIFWVSYLCGLICNLLVNASYYSKEMQKKGERREV